MFVLRELNSGRVLSCDYYRLQRRWRERWYQASRHRLHLTSKLCGYFLRCHIFTCLTILSFMLQSSVRLLMQFFTRFTKTPAKYSVR